MKILFWIFGTIYFIVLKVSVIEAKLELIRSDDPNVDFSVTDNSIDIAMDEENTGDVIIGYIIQDTGTNTPEMQFYPASHLAITGMVIKQTGEAKKYELVVTKKQDYESQYKSFAFDIWDNVDRIEKQINLKIKNIDDNIPYLTSNDLQCAVKEDYCCDTGCEYKITDDDREMDKISWLIDGEEEHDLFEFIRIYPENLIDNEMVITLKLKKKLVYEDNSIYVINLGIKDTAHAPDPTRILINVEDVANLPPVWGKIFQSQTFLEESEQEFQVSARDGDIGIGTPVWYQLIFDPVEDWNAKVSIDRNEGKIMVGELDRDKENRDIYIFSVMACEVIPEEISSKTCITQEITFILTDINDNRPIFKIDQPTDINNENIINLQLLETTSSSISTKISVNDIDSGGNARYSLILSGVNAIDHKSAFSVAPENGYQETTVDIFIINYFKLDYEDEDWRDFSLTLTAQEFIIPTNPTVVHEPITFHITLLNRNDEIPFFQKCNDDEDTKDDDCVIRIEETFNDINTPLIKMNAVDLDVDGTITYAILGTYANQILRIEPSEGFIYVQDLGGRRPFDYETLNEVIVQVQVKDYLEADKDTVNIALSQLTIKLEDVNDETPRISIETTGDGVPENCGTECNIGITIIATDDDSTADLEISINWGESSAIKNGRKVTDSPEFAPYMYCVQLDIQPTWLRSTLKAGLVFIETVDTQGNTPDFEIFDTLDLKIVVKDKNQPESDTIPNYATINVQIYINDLNDNEPKFPSTISEPYIFKVTEKVDADTLIGYTTATDLDVGAKLFYSIRSKDDNPTFDGLVKIDENDGKLTTTTKQIDADTDKIYKLYYIVTVFDEEHFANAEVEIDVEDINDQDPKFGDDIKDVKIPEQSEEGTPVAQYLATDGDRDEINNKIRYSFSSNMDSILRNYFKIDDQTGEITLSDQKLDRDDDIPPAPILIHIEARDPGNRVDSRTFRVVVTDINNKKPVLLTKGPFYIGEDSLATQLITELKASDADDADNSNVSFEIIGEIEGKGKLCNDEEKIKFVLTEPNEVERTVKLVTDVDLEGFTDDYKVTIRMTDRGDHPLSSEDTITVHINKYNFKPPVITNPNKNDKIYLALYQIPGNPIQLLDEGKTLTLEADDDQCGKYSPTFSVTDDSNLFTITSSGYLTIQTANFVENTPYEATIKATTIGQPSDLSSEISVTFFFVNFNISPVFDDENRQDVANNFHENEIGETFTFPNATYETEIAEELELPIYYIIIEGGSIFSIPNNQQPVIRMDQEVDYEETPVITVVVLASNRESGEIGGSDRAKITITVNIQDVNDNPPEFESEIYYTTLEYDNRKDTILITVKATDPDVSDVISYFIVRDSNYPSTYPLLNIDNNGALKLAADSSSAATGYTTVTILARDCVNNDAESSLCVDGHEASTNVEIYVVSEDKHIVTFKFKNLVVDVENQRKEIVEVLSNTFTNEKETPYQANVKRAIKDESNTDSRDDGDSDTSTITICEVYFIDTDSHEPVDNSLIESFATDVKTFDKLQQEFTKYGLILISFATSGKDVDNTVEVLRAWLIGVSVVLGVLCVLLIVAFVLKTRSLTNRLNNLSVTKFGSQESGLNRPVAPNTNRNALEGSNPVYSTEKTFPEERDRHSISSGDSDLIGVEDNPDFERKYQSNGIERY